MKSLDKVIPGQLLILLILFPVSSSLFAQPAQVKRMINDVKHYSKSTDQTDKSKPGQLLNNGDAVITGERSFASVMFTDDKSVLLVRENSSVEIYGNRKDSKEPNNTTINSGKLNFNIIKNQDQKFIFTTPTAVASIRGTTGYISVLPDLSTSIYIDSGSVEVTAKLGTQSSGIVSSGMSAIVNSDGSVIIRQGDDSTRNEFQKTLKVDVRRAVIKTDKGEIIIEYLD